MNPKKIVAFAKDNTGKFVRNSDGKLERFYIWRVLRMRRDDTFQYNKLGFYDTHPDEKSRGQMTAVKDGFFRYLPNQKIATTDSSSEGQTISHLMAIAVIEELQNVTFVVGDSRLNFNFTRLRSEDTRINLPSGRTYFPDLIGEFESDHLMHDQWRGKVAIEVKVTHGCEDEKLRDFDDHAIPIIEVTITGKLQFQKELYNQAFDENDLEQYYQFIKNKLSQGIFAKVVVDTAAPIYLRRQIQSVESNCDKALREQQRLDLELTIRAKELQNLQSKFGALEEEHKSRGEVLTKLSAEVKDLKSKWAFAQEESRRHELEVGRVKGLNCWERVNCLFSGIK